jgi:hypothetical protein
MRDVCKAHLPALVALKHEREPEDTLCDSFAALDAAARRGSTDVRCGKLTGSGRDPGHLQESEVRAWSGLWWLERRGRRTETPCGP